MASDFRKDKKLHSKSGTLAYLAPEVYAGHGYLSEVDWWSLGVTFYECIYNKVSRRRNFDGGTNMCSDLSRRTITISWKKKFWRQTPNIPLPSRQSRCPVCTPSARCWSGMFASG